MLEVLQFYVSGFWVWLGITCGLSIVGQFSVALVFGAIGALRGINVRIGDVKKSEPPDEP